MKTNWKSYPWLRISLLMYLLACCTPALEITTTAMGSHTPIAHVPMWGFQILTNGYLGIFWGIVGWYANPLWLVALVLAYFKWVKTAFVIGSASLVIALSTFLALGKEMSGLEAQQYVEHVSFFLPGCFFWMASVAAIPLDCWLRIRVRDGKAR